MTSYDSKEIEAHKFVKKYINIFNNYSTRLRVLYRHNSKLYFENDVYNEIDKIVEIVKNLEYTIDDYHIGEIQISDYPNAIKVYIDYTSNSYNKKMNQILHIAMDDTTKSLYIIEEELNFYEK